MTAVATFRSARTKPALVRVSGGRREEHALDEHQNGNDDQIADIERDRRAPETARPSPAPIVPANARYERFPLFPFLREGFHVRTNS